MTATIPDVPTHAIFMLSGTDFYFCDYDVFSGEDAPHAVLRYEVDDPTNEEGPSASFGSHRMVGRGDFVVFFSRLIDTAWMVKWCGVEATIHHMFSQPFAVFRYRDLVRARLTTKEVDAMTIYLRDAESDDLCDTIKLVPDSAPLEPLTFAPGDVFDKTAVRVWPPS